MSADNYHVVRKHPDGGYTYVQGFASDDDPDLSVTDRDPRFDMFDDALNAAVADYSEYGTTVHPECREWADTNDRLWYRQGWKDSRTDLNEPAIRADERNRMDAWAESQRRFIENGRRRLKADKRYIYEAGRSAELKRLMGMPLHELVELWEVNSAKEAP